MVSAIITTYNRRDFVKEAIESVLNQDHRPEEIIVVDDGSDDGTEEEVKKYPVKYVWKENGGVSSARNLGIKISNGEYIAFLDSDDLWLKKKVSTQVHLMESLGYHVSYTDEIWIRNGRRVNPKKKHKKYSGFIYDKCLPLCIISPSSVMIKRQVFEKVGLFDESLPVCEDYDMWLRITALYPVLFIEKPLIVKRGGHEDQLSKKYEAIDRMRIKALLKIFDTGVLTPQMKKITLEEIQRKSLIVANGAKKRNKLEEAEYYYRLAEYSAQALKEIECAQQESNLQPLDS
ncbi:MAG: glycosyltransferase family 2 protein [Desulfobacterota bacterium]|nr:glycosyltransferase family 2 protein [Thermodesulfobacteriota bacterium]MDW8002604.1 glycosyltransferase family A protein [Deltaproteobacteria bacterium]